MNRGKSCLFLLLFFFQCGHDGCLAQKPSDTLNHKPTRAALYSAVLPGLGQGYNKKYWKIPVIYAGFGTMAYFINMNSKEYRQFRDAYDFRYAVENGLAVDSSKYNAYVEKYPLSSLLDGRDYYRRNRDLTYIISAAWYILGIVDAAVDAYFFKYDISNNISLRLGPSFQNPGSSIPPNAGIRMSLVIRDPRCK